MLNALFAVRPCASFTSCLNLEEQAHFLSVSKAGRDIIERSSSWQSLCRAAPYRHPDRPEKMFFVTCLLHRIPKMPNALSHDILEFVNPEAAQLYEVIQLCDQSKALPSVGILKVMMRYLSCPSADKLYRRQMGQRKEIAKIGCLAPQSILAVLGGIEGLSKLPSQSHESILHAAMNDREVFLADFPKISRGYCRYGVRGDKGEDLSYDIAIIGVFYLVKATGKGVVAALRYMNTRSEVITAMGEAAPRRNNIFVHARASGISHARALEMLLQGIHPDFALEPLANAGCLPEPFFW